MKTIEVNLYKFSELPEETKEKVLNNWRNDNYFDDFYITDANNTFKSFAKLFNINWRNIDYCEPYRNEYSIKLDDNVIQLSGQRLSTYIWNNYKNDLFKGKYLYKKPLSGNTKSKHSKIQLEHSCVLTGVCYDDDILAPIYEFLDKPKDNINFETLINDCIYSLCHSVSSEIEYQNTDEAITETIEANDYDFTEDGNLA